MDTIKMEITQQTSYLKEAKKPWKWKYQVHIMRMKWIKVKKNNDILCIQNRS